MLDAQLEELLNNLRTLQLDASDRVVARLESVEKILRRGLPRRIEPARAGQYGGTFLVAPNIPGTVSTPEEEQEEDWTIEIQASAMPNGALSTLQAAGYFAAKITYGSGTTTFTKVLAPLGLAVRRLPVTARQVQVSVFWIGAGAPSFGSAPANAAAIPVNIAVSRGGQNKAPAEWWGAGWVLSQQGGTGGNLYGATTVQVVSGMRSSGIMTAARLAVSGMPTGAGASGMMAMLFDSPTGGAAPTTGAVPIWRSKPLVAANDWDSYDDEFAPQIEWTRGLWLGLSSTFGTWTACGSAPSLSFDIKAGS